MKTGFECTAYFRGKDGRGTCDTECQWWAGWCPAAKGSKEWDGIEHDKEVYDTYKDIKLLLILEMENYNRGVINAYDNFYEFKEKNDE